VKTSETLTKLAPDLIRVQGAVGVAVKDAKNPHLNSRYADLGSVFAACWGPLGSHGFAVVQAPSYSDGHVHLTTRLQHVSGEFIEETLSTPIGRKSDAQAVGSAITYLRRYMLSSMVGIVTGDDDGHGASQRPVRQQEQRREEQPQRPQPPPAEDPALGTRNDLDRWAWSVLQVGYPQLERFADERFQGDRLDTWPAASLARLKADLEDTTHDLRKSFDTFNNRQE